MKLPFHLIRGGGGMIQIRHIPAGARHQLWRPKNIIDMSYIGKKMPLNIFCPPLN